MACSALPPRPPNQGAGRISRHLSGSIFNPPSGIFGFYFKGSALRLCGSAALRLCGSVALRRLTRYTAALPFFFFFPTTAFFLLCC
jgi:hypothetical protein